MGADQVVRLAGQRRPSEADPPRRREARARVHVHERLDGSLAVSQLGRGLSRSPAPAWAPLRRACTGPRVTSRSAAWLFPSDPRHPQTTCASSLAQTSDGIQTDTSRGTHGRSHRLTGASTRNHPAPFPLELAERLVRMFSFVGDTVLDPLWARARQM